MKMTAGMKKGILYLHLSGELDHHSAGPVMRQIEDKLEVNLPRDCVIDMAGLSFMDSSGIAVVLKAYRRMNTLGGRLWVENVQPQPMRVLDASGIDRIIGITALATGGQD